MAKPLPPVFGPQSPARLAAAREIGIRSVSRTTRWVVAGSFGLAAVLSTVAAAAFSGHARSGTAVGAGATTRKGVIVALPPRQHPISKAPRPSPTPRVVAPPPAPPAATGGSTTVVSGGS
jgi:hypothetical protein